MLGLDDFIKSPLDQRFSPASEALAQVAGAVLNLDKVCSGGAIIAQGQPGWQTQPEVKRSLYLEEVISASHVVGRRL